MAGFSQVRSGFRNFARDSSEVMSKSGPSETAFCRVIRVDRMKSGRGQSLEFDISWCRICCGKGVCERFLVGVNPTVDDVVIRRMYSSNEQECKSLSLNQVPIQWGTDVRPDAHRSVRIQPIANTFATNPGSGNLKRTAILNIWCP